MDETTEVRTVRLRGSGIKARVRVVPTSHLSLLAGHLGIGNKSGWMGLVIYYFCENLLEEIIPSVVGKDEKYREGVFNELYESIKYYNPGIENLPQAERADIVDKVDITVRVENKRLPRKKVKENKERPEVFTKQKVRGLAEHLNSVIFGQGEVTRAIQKYFEMAVSGLKDPSRPRGVFLFAGDTGTGKTFCVKELAKYFFGKEWKDGLFTINGGEYQESHEAMKLRGAPASYVGYDDGSPFFKHVAKNPDAIILFDEFEKAHPDVQDLFMQIMDEAEAYDNKGNRVDFSRTFIVFTSNVGTKEVYRKESLGFGAGVQEEDAAVYVDSALTRLCRPEFLKRFDGTVVFNLLKREHFVSIAKTEVTFLAERLKEKSIKLRVSSKVYEVLADSLEKGDTARDLNTLVRVNISAPISHLLCSDEDFNAFSVTAAEGVIDVKGVGVGDQEG